MIKTQNGIDDTRRLLRVQFRASRSVRKSPSKKLAKIPSFFKVLFLTW
jgi:hypothetical protein